MPTESAASDIFQHKAVPTVVVDDKPSISKKRKQKITQEDVIGEQYKALMLKSENLALKKRKLELEVFVLEKKVLSECSNVPNDETIDV